MKETNIQRAVMKACAPHGITAFRNNVGSAWRGQIHRTVGGVVLRCADGSTVTTERGDLLIKRPTLVSYGLHKGSSDLIGWKVITVTPEMVGQKLAIFTALEVKAAKGKATAEQLTFLRAVQAAGGKAHIIKSPNDLINV